MKMAKDWLSIPLIYLAMVCLTMSYIQSFLYTFFLLLIFISLGCFFYINKEKKSVISQNNFFLFSFVFVLFALPSLVIKEPNVEYIKHIIVMFAMICAGYMLSETRPLNVMLSRIPLILLSFYFLMLFALGVPSSGFLQNNSENFVSVALFLAYFLSFALSKKYRVDFIDVILAGLCFFLCLISIGRAGIVTAGFMFVALLLVYVCNLVRSLSSRVLRFSIFIAGILALFFFTGVIIDSLIEIGLLDRILNRGFTDYSREFIILTYFKYLEDVLFFLGGVDFFELNEFAKYGNNLHNSYLTVHALFGLPFFTLYIYLLFQVGYWLFKDRDYVLLVILMAICVRATTDVQIFAGKLDWILFFLFFSKLNGKIGNRNLYTKDSGGNIKGQVIC